MLCNPKRGFEFFSFLRGGGCQLKVVWKKCATETTFFYVFNQHESKKDVPLTTFSEAKNGLDFGKFFLLVVKKAATHIHPWKSIISSKFMDRIVYQKCCVLTTWKFIDFHVNLSLATNGNERFVWVDPLKTKTKKHVCLSVSVMCAK